MGELDKKYKKKKFEAEQIGCKPEMKADRKMFRKNRNNRLNICKKSSS